MSDWSLRKFQNAWKVFTYIRLKNDLKASDLSYLQLFYSWTICMYTFFCWLAHVSYITYTCVYYVHCKSPSSWGDIRRVYVRRANLHTVIWSFPIGSKWWRRLTPLDKNFAFVVETSPSLHHMMSSVCWCNVACAHCGRFTCPGYRRLYIKIERLVLD